MIRPRTTVYSRAHDWSCVGLALLIATLPQLAVAQQAAAKTTLITLGTQGGPLQKQKLVRSRPTFSSSTMSLTSLTPETASLRQLALVGVPLGRVGQIFITHNHDDHNADLGTMMGLAWTLGRSAPITVHGPKGTQRHDRRVPQILQRKPRHQALRLS